MIVLGLETTCDETAWAIVRDGHEVLASSIASQVDLHALYGGVFPELACRRHIDVMIPLLDQTLSDAGLSLKDIDLIAVAMGPGLAGALLLGSTGAKTLALALRRPFIGIHHLEAHLFAAALKNVDNFQGLGLVLSGGHSLFVEILELGHYKIIGQTLDDAMGECFDKVAVMLGLTYPGGEKIEQLALSGNPNRYLLKAPKLKDRPFDCSFSGLKTSIAHLIAKLKAKGEFYDENRLDLAASFQRAAIETITAPLKRYLETIKPKNPPQKLFLGGGVARNQALRSTLSFDFPGLKLILPPFDLCSDNAVMVAGLAYHRFLKGEITSLTQAPRPRWPLTEQNRVSSLI